LLGVAALLTVVELGVRFGIGKLSRIEGRMERERRAVLALRGNPDAARTVLVLGNSLMLEGIDFPSLQGALAPEFKAVRYVVEQTQYTDWYYGLRAFYAADVRPGFIALNLNATSTTNHKIRGDYSAYRMMQTSDLLAASRDAELSPTETFSLFLGGVSAYYGTRAELRNVALARLLPVTNQIVKYLTPDGKAPPLDHALVVRVAAQRLRTLDAMVHAHGGRFMLLVPGTLDANDAAYLLEAGRLAAVPVLAPMTFPPLSAGDFRDGFHLNSIGSERYTQALNPMLKQKVAEMSGLNVTVPGAGASSSVQRSTQPAVEDAIRGSARDR
jgi:hypothetical protein